jgi:Zn-dependent peptidase ImmA (M78 family)
LEANDGRLRRFTVAHEIGHWIFHCDAARLGSLSLFHDGRIWCRSGSVDPVERQAEMFAARLLMPSELVRRSVPKTPWKGWPQVYDLANDFLVNATPMIIRLEELRLAHRDGNGQPVSGPKPLAGQTRLFET